MKQLTAILLLLCIAGIQSAFKLDNAEGATDIPLASDKPAGKDTMYEMWTGTKAATDCGTTLSVDANFVTDYAYKECLSDNCQVANLDWSVSKAKVFDQVPLTIIACYRICSPMATEGNAKKHAACISAGLTAAGVKSTELMQDYVVLGPVSLFYEGNIPLADPLKFNSYGRYMRDVLKTCGKPGNTLWESGKGVAQTGRIFRLVHAAKVKKMKDASICSAVIKKTAAAADTLDLKVAHDCLLEASKMAFPADAEWLTCAADAALPITGGRFQFGTVYAPDGEQEFDQKDKGGKLNAVYTSFASCIGALAGTAFDYAQVYEGYVNKADTGDKYLNLAGVADVNHAVDITKLGLNVLHDQGYQVKHCYAANPNCIDFSKQFITMKQWVKNYNQDVITKLSSCEQSCLDGYTIENDNDPTIASHSDAYSKLPTNLQMTLQTHFKAEISKYRKCHTDFKDSWYKTQQKIRNEEE